MVSPDDSDPTPRAPALPAGAYAVGDRVGRVSGVLSDVTIASDPDIGAARHVGGVHQTKEDQYLVARLVRSLEIKESSLQDQATLDHTQGWLILLADGTGANEAGEVASAVALSAVAERVLSAFPWETSGAHEVSPLNHAAATAFERSQALLTEYAEVCGIEHPTSASLTAALVVWPVLHLFHVGQTYCFLQRNGVLTRLGVDTPPPPHMASHPLAAGQEKLELQAHSHCLKPGDVLMFCTDGIPGALDEVTLLDILRAEHGSSRACAEQIAQVAKARNGVENLTVVIAAFSG